MNATRGNEKRSAWNAVKSAEVLVSLVVGILAIGGTVYGLISSRSENPVPGPGPITTSAMPRPQPEESVRTKSQYIKDADALCMTVSNENDAVHQQYGASIDGVQHTTALLEHLARDWARIQRPSGDEQIIEEAIDELRKSNEAAEQAIFAYRNNDNPSYQRYVQEQFRHSGLHEQHARSYGFEVCGQY